MAHLPWQVPAPPTVERQPDRGKGGCGHGHQAGNTLILNEGTDDSRPGERITGATTPTGCISPWPEQAGRPPPTAPRVIMPMATTTTRPGSFPPWEGAVTTSPDQADNSQVVAVQMGDSLDGQGCRVERWSCRAGYWVLDFSLLGTMWVLEQKRPPNR
ncbi:MAG: hypothetical protein H7836_09400 [Magnetococcus sp. YQC-3]